MPDENMSHSEAKLLNTQVRIQALQEALSVLEARHLEDVRNLEACAGDLAQLRVDLNVERRVSQAYRELIIALYARTAQ